MLCLCNVINNVMHAVNELVKVYTGGNYYESVVVMGSTPIVGRVSNNSAKRQQVAHIRCFCSALTIMIVLMAMHTINWSKSQL